MSACVKWAKEQVDTFNAILARQLSGTQKDGELWKQCLREVHEHGAMLSTVGLDFKDMIGVVSTTPPAPGQNGPIGLGID